MQLGSLRFGFEVMLIGFAGVFIALSVLYVLLVLMERFFTKKNRTGEAPPKTREMKVLAPPRQETPVEAGEEGDGELIAVITAALSLYLQKPRASLAIRGITPAGKTNSWVHYGRTRNMDVKNSVSLKRREKRR